MFQTKNGNLSEGKKRLTTSERLLETGQQRVEPHRACSIQKQQRHTRQQEHGECERGGEGKKLLEHCQPGTANR